PISRMQLGPRSSYRRRTELNTECLWKLAQAVCCRPGTVREAVLHTNPTLFESGRSVRFYEVRVPDGGVAGGRRRNMIYGTDQFVRTVCAKATSGATLDELAVALRAATKCTTEQAVRLVEKLIDAQILVPDVYVPTVGDSPARGLASQLARVSTS